MSDEIRNVTDAERPDIYETRAIAFLDILGFSDLIASGGAEKEISELFDALKVRASQVEKISKAGRMQFSAFSDCIVVSEEYLDGFGADRIAGYAAFLCLELLGRGFLVRGGLTIGPLHHRDGTVFGPALIEAYRLESKVAIFPRIVVSSEFQGGVLKSAVEKRGGLDPQYGVARALGIFRTDFDGIVHIDVFGPLIPCPGKFLEASGRYQDPEPGKAIQVTLGLAADAARNAVRRTRELRFKPAARQKYDWMDRYLAESAARYGWPAPGKD